MDVWSFHERLVKNWENIMKNGWIFYYGDQSWRQKIGWKPRNTWLDNVEAEMAELDIDSEDIHDRKKWDL